MPGPGEIMGRWIALKLRDAISNWRKDRKKDKQKVQEFNNTQNPTFTRDPNLIYGEGFTMRKTKITYPKTEIIDGVKYTDLDGTDTLSEEQKREMIKYFKEHGPSKRSI